jgi:hypothetical protein
LEKRVLAEVFIPFFSGIFLESKLGDLIKIL